MSTIKTCDVCRRYRLAPGRGHDVTPVDRFSVRRYKPYVPGESHHNRNNTYQGRFESAGSIDLCERCWEEICKPRMRPQKRPWRLKNQHTA